MQNPLYLSPNQSYKVIKPFSDFDRQEHAIGETWTFVETNFIPYYDGLTVQIIKEGVLVAFRLQWTQEQQSEIIDNFKDFDLPSGTLLVQTGGTLLVISDTQCRFQINQRFISPVFLCIKSMPMEFYDDHIPIKAALAQLFKRFGFTDDAYTAKWFVIYVGKFPIYVPNIPSRVRIARFHDIHHVLTGYPANWKGEAEIGAWELATGCRTSFVAWFLNGGAVFVGLFLWPKAVWHAFIRGWRSKTNLYHDFEYEPLLAESVRDLRQRIGLAEN